MPFLVELTNVTFGYNDEPILCEVNLPIEKGIFTGLVGPSGSGKTTLLKIILGLLKPWKGKVIFLGQALPRVGYVPQLETVDWSFPATVEEVVMMGRWKERLSFPFRFKKREDPLLLNILEKLGIGDLASHHIRDLSGGEQHRVFLARALISQPELLILDEPLAGVDLKTQHEILHFLDELNNEGITILLTTHDLISVAAHIPQVICFNHEVIAQGPPEEVFTREVLEQTYKAEMAVFKQKDLVCLSTATHHSEKEFERKGFVKENKENKE